MLYLLDLFLSLLWIDLCYKQSRLANLISKNKTLLSCLEGNISCSVLSCKCWIKSVSLQYSCVEFYKENLLEYSLLLAVLPRNWLYSIGYLIYNSLIFFSGPNQQAQPAPPPITIGLGGSGAFKRARSLSSSHSDDEQIQHQHKRALHHNIAPLPQSTGKIVRTHSEPRSVGAAGGQELASSSSLLELGQVCQRERERMVGGESTGMHALCFYGC